MNTLIRGAALSAALLAAAGTAAAQTSGGTLRFYHRDNPPSASIHEEATISTLQPFMPVFNNLVVYNQHAERSSPDDLTPELARSWEWNPDRTRLTFRLRGA